MAYELQIRGTQDRVKMRSPWAAALLPLITLGIYHLVWWYRVHGELRDYGRARGYDLGQNPTSSVLALFPGGMVVVPALITYWRGVKRVQGAAGIAGKEPVNGWLSLVLYLLLAPALWAYLQSSLNDVWRSEADPLPGQAAPPAASGPMPPRLADEPQASAQAAPEAAPPPAATDPQAAPPEPEPGAPPAPPQEGPPPAG